MPPRPPPPPESGCPPHPYPARLRPPTFRGSEPPGLGGAWRCGARAAPAPPFSPRCPALQRAEPRSHPPRSLSQSSAVAPLRRAPGGAAAGKGSQWGGGTPLCRRPGALQPQLEELHLDAKPSRQLPKPFFWLLRLGLSDNEIQRLSPEMAKFMQLAELDISRNTSPGCPSRFARPWRLRATVGIPCAGSRRLHAAAQPGSPGPDRLSLQGLPRNLGNFANLVTLELRWNLLKSLPAFLAFGSGEAMIWKCFLKPSGDTLGALPKLRELRLDRNQLWTLPWSSEICGPVVP